MDGPTALDLLREHVATLPEEAEDHALAALAALSDPDVASATLSEQAVQERLAAAKPHLVKGAVRIVTEPDRFDDEGNLVEQGGTRLEGPLHCPDCTRGTYSIGGVLVCWQLPAKVGTMKGKPGDLVACGKER